MKLVIASLLILPIIESKYFLRVNKIECGVSRKTVDKYKCFLKSYDRKNPTINGEFRLMREVPNGKLNFDHFRRTNSDQSYKQILNFHNCEICRMIEDGSKSIFFTMFIELFRPFQGNILNLCHTQGLIRASNISFVNTTFGRLFPAGEHKTSLKFFDDIDDNIGFVNFYTMISE